MTDPNLLSIGQCSTLACLIEISSPKPGNVHRGADFADATFLDFATSAVAIGPVMERAVTQPVGMTIREAIGATRQFVGTNTNLGIVLLLAPLAAVPRNQQLGDGVRHVLGMLDAEDAKQTYAAICRAKAGGLGQVEHMDLHGKPPQDLLLAMQAAADRDLVARQYATNFQLVLEQLRPRLVESCGRWGLVEGVVYEHIRLLATYPDSLIARKCGQQIASEASARASHVIASGVPGQPEYLHLLGDLDFWLRSNGQRRNPGTTADLITAGLFANLRDGRLCASRDGQTVAR